MSIDNLVQWNKNNPERTKRYALAYQQRLRERTKREVFEAYGGVICACCGEDNIGFLTIDHINNDGGGRNRGPSQNGSMLYHRLKKEGYPPGYQVLCYNCNIGRAHNDGVCPHKDTGFTLKKLMKVLGVMDYEHSTTRGRHNNRREKNGEL
jgi:hypothetical protein